MVKTISLKGYTQFANLAYATNTVRPGFYFLRTHNFKDTTLKYLDSYKLKAYDARFLSSDRAIIASNYAYSKPETESKGSLFRSQVLYFGASYLDRNYPDPYFNRADHLNLQMKQDYYDFIDVSDNRLLFALAPANKEEIILTRSDGYVMVGISGKYPQFSKAKQVLYYLNGNKIMIFPLDLKQIFSMVLEKKIFGDPGTGKQAWKLI
jgi:hypothetical protein